MMKKTMLALMFFSVNAAMFASTPVGQGIPFPIEAPNSTEVHAQAKRNNRPPVAQSSAAPALLRFDNKRSKGYSLTLGNSKRQK